MNIFLNYEYHSQKYYVLLNMYTIQQKTHFAKIIINTFFIFTFKLCRKKKKNGENGGGVKLDEKNIFRELCTFWSH